ncbi:MAG: MBL fold metallo-hydrolase [Acidobacteriia bacterium]|nr:MBL fold metallo-hydrolase [Terriglobia bacterium]
MRILKLATIAFFLLAWGARAQAPAGSPFILKPLGQNVWAAIDDARGDAGANAGFVIGDDGVAVIDTFENAAAARQMLAEIHKLTKLPVKFVINTHYHLDHVAGNGVFAEAGAVVFAQRNVRTWIHTENRKFFGKEINPEQKALVEGLTAPEAVYEGGSVELYLGARRIVVRYYPGHTGGDSVVEIPDAQVVFCGDLFWRKTLPNLIDASAGKWLETLAKLGSVHPSATFVPGHGDVGNAGDVAGFAQYLEGLRQMVAAELRQEKKGAAVVEAVLPQLKARYGTWGYFEEFAKSNIMDMEAELRGEKKTQQPAEAP